MPSILNFLNHSKLGLANFLLLPFSFIFFLIYNIRLWLYKLGWLKIKTFKLPVIVVGNITTGGTGKTPIVISIANYFATRNKTVGIVSRGYGGKYTQEALEVTSISDPAECGDEPLLIKQQTHAVVIVVRKRSKAVDFLIQNHSVDIIISDDGLQHYSMGRSIEIAVIDGYHRLGNGLFLPAGPLRESKKRLKSVDFVINNGSYSDGEVSSQIEPECFINLVTNEKKEVDFFKSETCYAVAAIGTPENFYSLLKKLGVNVITKAFPDHYSFDQSDLTFDEDYPILMTAKDCVKCNQFATNRMWYLSVNANISPDFYKQLESKL